MILNCPLLVCVIHAELALRYGWLRCAPVLSGTGRHYIAAEDAEAAGVRQLHGDRRRLLRHHWRVRLHEGECSVGPVLRRDLCKTPVSRR